MDALTWLVKMTAAEAEFLTSPPLQKLFAHWRDESNFHYGPGVLDLKFDIIETLNDGSVEQLLELIDVARQKLDEQGEYLVHETQAVKTSQVAQTLDQIKDLLCCHKNGVFRISAVSCLACESN